MEDKDIDKLAEKWNRCKREIADLEKKMKRYRDKIEEEMNDQSVNHLDTNKYYISRISCSKTTMTKKDVPEDIWDKYCKRCKYYMYNIKEKK